MVYRKESDVWREGGRVLEKAVIKIKREGRGGGSLDMSYGMKFVPLPFCAVYPCIDYMFFRVRLELHPHGMAPTGWNIFSSPCGALSLRDTNPPRFS